VKIPALDVTLLASSPIVLAVGIARTALAQSGVLSAANRAAALVATTLVAPVIFAAYVLWKGAPVRATGWRRAGARVAAIGLWALSLTSALVDVGLPIPAALAIDAKSAALSCVALSLFALCVWLTSPARRGVSRRRAK